METPAPVHAPPSAPAPPRPRGLRTAVLVVAAVAVAGAAFLLSRQGRERPPEALFDALRDRVLAGDGEAVWRETLPRARVDYATFVKQMATRDDAGAPEWRRYVGLSKEDLRTLPPDKVMARENLAAVDEFFRGARVHRVDRWDESTALLFITTARGQDRHWQVTRVDGAWKIDNFQPSVTAAGVVIPRSGESPRPGRVPTDGFPDPKKQIQVPKGDPGAPRGAPK